MDDQNVGIGLFDLDPQRAECVDRVHAVVARQEPPQITNAVGQAGNNSRAMRDTLVPGNGDFRLDSRRSFNS